MAIHTLTQVVRTNLNITTVPFEAGEFQTAVNNGDFFTHFSASQIAPLLHANDTEGIYLNPELMGDSIVLRMGRSLSLGGGVADDPVGHPASPTFSGELVFADNSLKNNWLQRLQNGQWLFRKVYFSAEEVKNLLGDSSNLFFRPLIVVKEDATGQQERFYTLMAYTTGNNNTPLNGIASALPCPPHCGSGDYKQTIRAIRPS